MPSRVIEGFFWRSARDSRTCAACLARHDTPVPLQGPIQSRRVVDIAWLDSHEGCRCAVVPRAKSYAAVLDEPGLPDRRPTPHPGGKPRLMARVDGPRASITVLRSIEGGGVPATKPPEPDQKPDPPQEQERPSPP